MNDGPIGLSEECLNPGTDHRQWRTVNRTPGRNGQTPKGRSRAVQRFGTSRGKAIGDVPIHTIPGMAYKDIRVCSLIPISKVYRNIFRVHTHYTLDKVAGWGVIGPLSPLPCHGRDILQVTRKMLLRVFNTDNPIPNQVHANSHCIEIRVQHRTHGFHSRIWMSSHNRSTHLLHCRHHLITIVHPLTEDSLNFSLAKRAPINLS